MSRASTLWAGDVSPIRDCKSTSARARIFAVVDDVAFIHDVINRELQECAASARDQNGEPAW